MAPTDVSTTPPRPAAGAALRGLRGRGIDARDLLFVLFGNVAVVVGLWWRGGGVADLGGSAAAAVTSGGRLTGLVGTALVLVQLLLLARIPVLERALGFDRLTLWHRRNGRAALILLALHAALITVGYALNDRIGLPRELWRLLTTYPGVITATAGLLLLVAVVVTSIVIVRRALRYETWYFVHLYAYLGIALAFSHQLGLNL